MAEITPFKGVIQSQRKAAWMDQVAQGYDKFAEECGEEPESAVYVLLAPGYIKSGWHFEEKPGFSSWVSMSLLFIAEHLRREASTGND